MTASDALFDAWLAMVTGVNAEEASTLDHANYIDTEQNGTVSTGYGALIAQVGADIPVTLSTPVSAVEWDGPGVRLRTPGGILSAAAVVITVSTGVLASGAIRFRPCLPDWKRAAVEA